MRLKPLLIDLAHRRAGVRSGGRWCHKGGKLKLQPGCPCRDRAHNQLKSHGFVARGLKANRAAAQIKAGILKQHGASPGWPRHVTGRADQMMIAKRQAALGHRRHPIRLPAEPERTGEQHQTQY